MNVKYPIQSDQVNGRSFSWLYSMAVGGGILTGAASAHAATVCSAAALQAFDVPGVTIMSAVSKPAASGSPAYCDVAGQLKTTGDDAPDGSAGFELQLPVNWNKKFLFFGVGGFAGAGFEDVAANPVDLQAALLKGYAVATTDAGHTGGPTDGSWALRTSGQPDTAKVVDYAYRATHQVTVAAQQMTRLFFNGQAIEASYFDGCSNGGRQALVEAARFPDDYQGVIAGSPGLDFSGFSLAWARIFKQSLTPETYIPASLVPVIDAAVKDSCDAADGVRDGLIQNPAACRFDPFSLVCKPGQESRCLSVGQADTLVMYMSAIRNPLGGVVYPGSPVSDLSTSSTGPLTGDGGADAWTTGLVPPTDFNAQEPWGNGGFSPAPIRWQFSDHIIQNLVTLDPTYNLRDLPVSREGYVDFRTLRLVYEKLKEINVADPRSFLPFVRKGGKMIVYHGFSDPAITPFATMKFYKQLGYQVEEPSQLQRSVRLFMVPGMQHCVGGSGPNVFDTLTSLESWVERAVAPDSILATHYTNNDPAQAVDRAMPLCPFPTQATHDGAGDVNSATSWSCRANRGLLQTRLNGIWAGSSDRH